MQGTVPVQTQDSALSRFFTYRRRNYMLAFLFVLPALINFTLFRYYPIASAAQSSLYNYSLLGGYKGFVGADHYIRMMSDAAFWNSLQVTLIYVLIKIPIQVGLALALALFLMKNTMGSAVVRSAIMAPMVTSIIVVSIIWALMYHSEQGLFQSILVSVGLPKMRFISHESRALPALTAMMIWKDVGFSMIILMAGLKGIPHVYYEAAVVDGANSWQRFWNVTIPLLRPVMMFVLVTQIAFSFQMFAPVFQMTKGGPLESTNVIVHYIYQQGFLFQDMGYASALSMVTLVILLVISFGQMKLMNTDY
ncbi:MAG: multiple sugar transport system permease protein [Cellvibrionaceae bacterium]|jgi:multiple sugar transport system permease protein